MYYVINLDYEKIIRNHKKLEEIKIYATGKNESQNKTSAVRTNSYSHLSIIIFLYSFIYTRLKNIRGRYMYNKL